MNRNRLRLVAAVLLVALAAPSWAAPHGLRPHPARMPSAEVGLSTIFARVWAAVAQRWQKNGMRLDPYGQCAAQETDPNGQCPTQENGMSLDPLGGSGT